MHESVVTGQRERHWHYWWTRFRMVEHQFYRLIYLAHINAPRCMWQMILATIRQIPAFRRN